MLTATVPLFKTTGFQVPCLGFGTYKIELDEIDASLREALDAGYRHIDCAHLYLNEDAIGETLEKWTEENKVKREDFFITSKTRHGQASVREVIKSSPDVPPRPLPDPLARPVPEEIVPTDREGKTLFDDVDITRTWKAMESLVQEGLVRHIGVSNFNEHQIKRIIECSTIKPVVLQIECNCHFPNRQLAEFAASNGIVVTAYAPLGCPYREVTDRQYRLIQEPILLELAKTHGKTAAQIAIRHLIQRGIVVIPKSKTPSRIRENLEVFDFELSDTEMAKIKGIGIHGRQIVAQPMRGHKEFPFLDLL